MRMQKNVLAAAAASTLDGVTFGWYPTGLAGGQMLTSNYLPAVQDYPGMRDPKLARLAKIIYEFDAADVHKTYMYPSMARAFRRGGAQSATQFQYDPMCIAEGNANTNEIAISTRTDAEGLHLKEYTLVEVGGMLRRAGFGGTKAQVAALAAQPWATTVDQLLDFSSAPADVQPLPTRASAPRLRRDPALVAALLEREPGGAQVPRRGQDPVLHPPLLGPDRVPKEAQGVFV